MEKLDQNKEYSDIKFTEFGHFLSPYYVAPFSVEFEHFTSYAHYFWYCFYKPWAPNFANAIKEAGSFPEKKNFDKKQTREMIGIKEQIAIKELVKRGPKLPESYTKSWNCSKLGVAWKGIVAKFEQNPYLETELLKSGSRRIFFENSDIYWGRNKKNRGLNYLGKILMKHRDDLQEKIMGGDSDDENESHNLECFLPLDEVLNGVDDDPNTFVKDVTAEFLPWLISPNPNGSP